MSADTNDRRILRELAQRYADFAAQPINDRRRELWRQTNSLESARPLVLVNFGMWNVWCREVFGDDRMQCADPFARAYERHLRMLLFHTELNDDYVFEPWIDLGATQEAGWNGLWGVPITHHRSAQEGGAWQFDPVLREEEDLAKLRPPPHRLDEAATARDAERLHGLIGDLLTINLNRNPACLGFTADISTHLAQLRGLEQLMLDMYERPAWLHRVLAFMRDGILANQAAAEAAGDLSMTAGHNQALPYSRELPDPKPNVPGVRRDRLWAFAAAQEFTGISPAMHDEFLLQYQIPIMARFGLAAYGCCEDLTNKIDMLRQVPNLRRIAVTPRANLARSVEQIGGDYVISWRPNPTDMVCCGFDEGAIRKIIGSGVATARGCHLDITLKDIETVEGETARLKRWVELVRAEIEEHW